MENPTMKGSAAANRRDLQRRQAEAARAMLAALREIEDSLELADKYGFEGELETVRAAIAAAEKAGISA